MSSDLTFLTNEPGKALLDRFHALLGKNTRFFDCLVGYFFISGFYKLYPSLEHTQKTRILIGLKTDLRSSTRLSVAKNNWNFCRSRTLRRRKNFRLEYS